jgi:hypothetical protein
MNNKPFLISVIAAGLFLLIAVILLKIPLGLNVLAATLGVVFLMCISLISYFLLASKAKDASAHKFVSSVMLSTIIKLFGCAAGAFVFIITQKNNNPRNTTFFLMFVYIIFAVIESKFVMQLNRNLHNKN